MISTETAPEPRRCQRPGCHGILRSAASRARGTSLLCDRKLRHALAAEAERGGFNAEQQAKADAAIRSGQVQTLGHGLYSVPSCKGDGTRYASDGISCVCPAGAHDRRCWHLLAARVADVLTRRLAPAPAPAPAPRDLIAELIAMQDFELAHS